MGLLFNKNKMTSTEKVDAIEKIVYEYLKQLGFKKYGRTLHRFVDGDISQVVNFQNGCPQKGVHNVLWVNIGIRIPECAERKFALSEPLKKYYHEYQCNIRNRLGNIADGKDTHYDLKKSPEKIGGDIVDKLKHFVIPVFEALSSRDSIIELRRDYAHFDDLNNNLLLLDEAMIYGRRGDIDNASRCFNQYYSDAVAEYKHKKEQGTQMYLRKGECLTYHNARTGETETITADKDGEVTLYSANHMHIEYLEQLAIDFGIEIGV